MTQPSRVGPLRCHAVGPLDRDSSKRLPTSRSELTARYTGWQRERFAANSDLAGEETTLPRYIKPPAESLRRIRGVGQDLRENAPRPWICAIEAIGLGLRDSSPSRTHRLRLLPPGCAVLVRATAGPSCCDLSPSSGVTLGRWGACFPSSARR